MSMEIGQAVGWAFGIFLGVFVAWLAGYAIYFTILDIRDIPKRRATKAMNARVDAIRAENRLKVNRKLHELYGTPLIAAENDRKWYELVGRRD